jgi:UDP-GlcNAc:undecaprenyl-phosphate/decaprenyl-phosphate GlcNAc-1-phosphate transferase
MIAFQFRALFLGLLVTLPIGLLSIAFCRKVNLLDIPGSAKHKIHQAPVPIAGGITLVVSGILLLFIFRASISKSLLSILLPALIIFTYGMIDDIRGLSALIKLSGQLLAAITMMLLGVSIQIFQHLILIDANSFWVFLPRLMDWLLTLFWIVGIVNAFNLIDSMDGLVSGISAWAFGFFVIAALDSNQPDLSNFAAIFLGINLVLSFYNSSPAKMFLGDSGAQTLGFLLAAISIIYAPIYLVQASSWFVPIMLLAVPIFDTCLVFFSRIRRKLPFYKANRDHTYHRLVNIGIDSHRAVFMMHMAALILQCLAMIAASFEPFHANLIFILCIFVGAAAIIILEQPCFLTQNTTKTKENKQPI